MMWAVAMGGLYLAAVMNQIAITLFRRAQAGTETDGRESAGERLTHRPSRSAMSRMLVAAATTRSGT